MHTYILNFKMFLTIYKKQSYNVHIFCSFKKNIMYILDFKICCLLFIKQLYNARILFSYKIILYKTDFFYKTDKTN